MNQVSIKRSEDVAQATEPLIWIALDIVGEGTCDQSLTKSLPRPKFFDSGGLLSDRIVELWSRLSHGKEMPDPGQLAATELQILSDRSITFELVNEPGGSEKRLEVLQIGNLVARMIGVDGADTKLVEAENLPLWIDLQTHFIEVFKNCRPVVFETTNNQRAETGKRIECVLMPFGDKNITSVVAVIVEASRLPEEHGDNILILEESAIVETSTEADAELASQKSGDSTGKSRKKTTQSSTTQNAGTLPLDSLISEARRSADAAREAEEKSRLASREALSRAYCLALAIARRPDEIALELVFGEDRSDDYAELLRQAREQDVAEDDLDNFLEEFGKW